MAEIGSVWASGTWDTGAWAANTWADAIAPEPSKSYSDFEPLRGNIAFLRPFDATVILWGEVVYP